MTLCSRAMPPQEVIRDALEIREDGQFYWKTDRARKIKAGTLAGSLDKRDGRSATVISLDAFVYTGGRLAWIYWFGEDIPHNHVVKFKDGNKRNHSKENLFLSTQRNNVSTTSLKTGG